MTWVDPLLLVVTSGVAGQLKDLCCEVFHDGCQIDWSSCANSLRVVSRAEKAVDSADGELKSSTCGTALGLGASFSSFSTSRHDACLVELASCEMKIR